MSHYPPKGATHAYLSTLAAKLARQLAHVTDGIERELQGVQP